MRAPLATSFYDRPIQDRPLAAAGLISYRCKSRYGWIMIGATNDEDAWREACRSSKDLDRNNLQIWNGDTYVALDSSSRL